MRFISVNNEQKHSATKKRIMREGIRHAMTGLRGGVVERGGYMQQGKERRERERERNI